MIFLIPSSIFAWAPEITPFEKRSTGANVSATLLVFLQLLDWYVKEMHIRIININYPVHIRSVGASFLAELSVTLPRQSLVFIIYRRYFWIQVSTRYVI